MLYCVAHMLSWTPLTVYGSGTFTIALDIVVNTDVTTSTPTTEEPTTTTITTAGEE